MLGPGGQWDYGTRDYGRRTRDVGAGCGMRGEGRRTRELGLASRGLCSALEGNGMRDARLRTQDARCGRGMRDAG